MPGQIYSPSGTSVPGRVVPSSLPFFTTGEDNLRITSWNIAAGVRLKLNARTISPLGELVPDSWDHTPNTDRSAKSNDYTLSGSTLLNLTVFAAAGSPLIGQTYVRVDMIRGTGTAAIVLGTILAGFVTATISLGFPGSAIVSPFDGEPLLRQLAGTTPGAGGAILETVPAGARWELITFYAPFTYIAGTLPNFSFPMTIKSGGTAPLGIFTQGTPFGGNADGSVTYSQDITPPNAITQNVETSLPSGLRLLAGTTINIPGSGGVINWGQPFYQVREWMDI